jgi:AAA+ ATPase superfamily predicted ATPase
MIRASLRPAIRNLYLMTPVLTYFMGAILMLITSAIQGTEPDWGGLALGMVFGVALGVAGGAASGAAGDVVVSVLFGVLFGVTVGVALGVAFGVTVGVALGVVFGVVFGVAGGVVLGVAAGVVGGMALGVAAGVVGGMAFGMAVGVVLGVASGVVLGAAGGVAGAMGGVRIPIYLLELLPCYMHRWWPSDPFYRLRQHPAWWDELAVLPLPGLVPLIQRCLEQNAERTFPLLTHLAANPFQRWAAQKALTRWLGQQTSPLFYLYHLAHDADLDAYFSPPAEPANFRAWPTARELALAEIGQVNVRNRYGDPMDNWVWRLTYRWRDTSPSPLAEFASFLYWCFRRAEWLVQAPVEEIAEILKQEKTQAQIQAIAHLPMGEEVVASFQLITKGLTVTDMVGIAALFSHDIVWDDLDKPLLRPTVIEALKALADVSQDVANGLNATSRAARAGALIRANGALQELAEYVDKQVLLPEQVLLARLVEHWQEIIAKEQGKLGAEVLQAMSPQMRREAGIGERQSAVWQRPVKPFDNPYIAGDPVYPPLLVGRTDIFNRIGEIWGAKANPDSIILYGHRRMGKSSILRNLAQAAPEKTIIAYADMQGKTSFVESTAGLLLELADQIVLALNAVYPEQVIPQPNEADYNNPERAQRALNQLTAQVRQRLGHKSLILALDEFEAVEKAVVAGKIGPEIYQFLRSKSMEPGLTLVFGGLHTLDEMSRDYAQPFYGSYTNIKVSYLPHQEAWRLITNPNEDFPLNYEPEAVERIISETGGQPYLVQLVCREALDHLNHTLFDIQQERDVLLTLADVEAVLDGGLFQRGMVYFDGVWSQATEENQRHLLRTLAGRAEPWAWDDIQQDSGLTATELKAALNWTERQDVMQKVGDPPVWQFYVPLMRQWIRTSKGIK